MKKLDITKYKKKMSCSVEKTQNKIDFWVKTCKKNAWKRYIWQKI